jgi:hypothetical protein
MTLPDLHRVIQAVMGWEDCHLHEFQVAGRRYEIPDPENSSQSIKTFDERRVKLSTIVREVGNEFNYLYDFGDGWEHGLLLEAILPGSTGVQYPRCTDGARSGLPEDVGGVGGYEVYLQALADANHEQHEEMLAWRGPFDSERFDMKAINRELARLFRVHR